jgi:diguanylate cyclase
MDTFSAYLFGALTAAAPLALGLVLGVYLARRGGLLASPDTTDADQMERLVRGLYQWTNSLVSDVDQCRERMHAIEADAQAVSQKPDAPAARYLDLMAQMADANKQMQQRLADAEDALARQAQKITLYLNEARTDVLTGLPNRRVFDEDLAQRHAEFQRYGVTYTLVLFDIDHFKQFNDQHGHLVGDEVLRCVAQKLGESLRDTDLLARYGGEEFAALLTVTPARSGQIAAERARQLVESSTFYFDGQPLRVTVSCGLAEPVDGEETRDLLWRADQALYASKHAGRNCSHLHEGGGCCHISSEVAAGPSPMRTASERDCATPGPDREQLQQACQDLRARLVEVMQ